MIFNYMKLECWDLNCWLLYIQYCNIQVNFDFIVFVVIDDFIIDGLQLDVIFIYCVYIGFIVWCFSIVNLLMDSLVYVVIEVSIQWYLIFI